MTPAVQNDSCNVALSVESEGAKHIGELVTNFCLVFRKRGSHHLQASQVALFLSGMAGKRIQDLQREHDGRIGTDGLAFDSSQRQLAHLQVVPHTLKPPATTYSHLVKEAPITQGDIRHHAW